jgi:predicted ArsR family transcriptional regulator
MSVQSDRLATIAALGEPLRREIYLYVAGAPGVVSRDQTAHRFGVSRGVAAFHLDKLAGLGLLDVEYHRPPGRRGPGAGRPAKFYRATTDDVSFSVPPREYELAGRLLAEAVTVSEQEEIPVSRALRDVARRVGQSLGERARQRAGEGPSRQQVLDAACAALSECAYEPRSDVEGFTLVNCPFHALAQQYRDLVCGMNLELMAGFADSLEDAGLEARLEPHLGQCCVRLTKSRRAPGPSSRSSKTIR